jgi:Phosphorylase superfamily
MAGKGKNTPSRTKHDRSPDKRQKTGEKEERKVGKDEEAP